MFIAVYGGAFRPLTGGKFWRFDQSFRPLPTNAYRGYAGRSIRRRGFFCSDASQNCLSDRPFPSTWLYPFDVLPIATMPDKDWRFGARFGHDPLRSDPEEGLYGSMVPLAESTRAWNTLRKLRRH